LSPTKASAHDRALQGVVAQPTLDDALQHKARGVRMALTRIALTRIAMA
jgi:hypothetical protein